MLLKKFRIASRAILKRRRFLSLFAFLATLSAASANAQVLSRSVNELGSALRNVFDLRPTDTTDWRLGVGPVASPAFEGSRDYKIRPAPVISVRYRDVLTVDNNEVDFTAFNQVVDFGDVGQGKFEIGPSVNLDFGRHESDSLALRGLGNVGFSVEPGAFVSFTLGPAAINLEISQDVARGHKGADADLSANFTLYRNERFAVGSVATLTWVSAAYIKSFFGITGTQSAKSGLATYRPGSGLKSGELGLVATYELSPHWEILGHATYKRMLAPAADSPLIAQRGDANQAVGSAFVVYKY